MTEDNDNVPLEVDRILVQKVSNGYVITLWPTDESGGGSVSKIAQKLVEVFDVIVSHMEDHNE